MLQEEFAKILDVHKNTVVRFESEKGKPNIEELNKVLTAFPDINPTWLLTGEGPMKRGDTSGTSPPLDEELLQAVLEAVEEYLDQVKGRLKPAKKAQLVAALYDIFCGEEEKAVDKATVIRLVKLAV
ncbi:helix-turn-helix domain-containing protein [Geobacter anodireducens]|uniref:Helix-turn-helix transcriptional regulator n=1 Tax=Geobacter anodireducens TaxID=1340425 RepID=A0ABR9NXL7_9BACT|nr:helix-turn-helix transcriptional regulator [Geobacter anodireducens]MBE2888987.1 helix-turn-helix transcriptional regulator [Geobacter anodireducens]